MIQLKKNYIIKIPKDISIIYSRKQKILIFLGLPWIKSINLNVQILINVLNNHIIISPILFSQNLKIVKEKVRILQRKLLFKIKNILIEVSKLMYKKLIITGVGFYIYFVKNFDKTLLVLKLGFSHSIYLKILSSLKINCLNKTKFCILGSSYENILELSSLIKNTKIPDPYKNKGIWYENEKIRIKKVKKI